MLYLSLLISRNVFQFNAALTCPGNAGFLISLALRPSLIALFFVLSYLLTMPRNFVRLLTRFGVPFFQLSMPRNSLRNSIIRLITASSVPSVSVVINNSFRNSCINAGVSLRFKSSPIAFTLPGLPSVSSRLPSLSYTNAA